MTSSKFIWWKIEKLTTLRIDRSEHLKSINKELNKNLIILEKFPKTYQVDSEIWLVKVIALACKTT